MPASVIDSSSPLAVFRFDASPAIGAGHAVRSLTLADTLTERGWRCAFAFRAPTATVVPALAGPGRDSLTLDGDDADEPQAMRDRWPDGCDLLVVDHYGRDHAFETACRPWAHRLMAIDDMADRRHACDVLLDQNLGRKAADYDGLVPDHCRRLVGPRHALLRPQFAAARRAALERRRSASSVRRIVVSLGATDPVNASETVLDGLDGIDARVDVVLGAAAPHLEAVRRRAATMSGDVAVHVGIDDMASLLSDADLAVGAAGSSSWERCCLGLPTVLLVLADNQRPSATGLDAAGAAVVVDSPADAGDAVRDLCRTTDHRRAIGSAAATLCDGYGAVRIVTDLLIPQPARDGAEVSLRPAAHADSQTMFVWQCDDRVRQFSRNKQVPTWEAHENWLATCLAGTDRLLTVILYGGEPAGVLRFDPASEGSGFEVSILVSPDMHGHGIGRAALGLARTLFLREDLYAVVLPGNTVSHALFQGAGYRPVREGLYINKPDNGKADHVP